MAFSACCTFWLCLLGTFLYACSGTGVTVQKTNDVLANYLESPVMPRIPKCYDNRKPINHGSGNDRNCIPELKKTTKKKFFMCAMFRNEEGFLAEFVSYYKIHGFDHIILWDGNSTDQFAVELSPWVNSGLVEVRSIPELIGMKTMYAHTSPEIQKEVERHCISWGIKNKYDYYLSVDIDEYVVPIMNSKHRVNDLHGYTPATEVPYVTIADVVDEVYSSHGGDTPRLTISMDRYQYTAAPHLLEPIDLLTIEAYNVRYLDVNRYNFYGPDVLPKMVFRLSGYDLMASSGAEKQKNKLLKEFNLADYNSDADSSFSVSELWLSNCCYQYGCEFPKDGSLCDKLSQYHAGGGFDPVTGKPNPGKFDSRQQSNKARHWLRINKYTRSLEKFQFKQRGEPPGSSAYDVRQYMDKAYGWHFDPIALVYSCLVRYDINQMYNALDYNPTVVLGPKELDSEDAKKRRTDSHYFLRSGDSWYRNPEFGRIIADLTRRGRGTGGSAAYLYTPYNPTTVKNIYDEHNKGLSHRFYNVYESVMTCKAESS